MNEIEFLEGINGIDAELTDDKSSVRRKKSPKRLRWIAVAAAAVLLCGSVTAGAVSLSKGRFSPITSGTHGYIADFGLKRYAWDEFTGGIAEAPEIIRDQYATFTPAPVYSSSSVDPGTYAKHFASFPEAAEYLGLKELKDAGSPFEGDVEVIMHGDSAGQINEVHFFSRHVVDPKDPKTGDFGGSLWVIVLTEFSDSSTVSSGGDWGDYDPGTIDYEEFVTSKGVLCQYAKVTGGDSGRAVITGYVVDSGILYSLSVNFYPEEYDTAFGMLKDWAERF